MVNKKLIILASVVFGAFVFFQFVQSVGTSEKIVWRVNATNGVSTTAWEIGYSGGELFKMAQGFPVNGTGWNVTTITVWLKRISNNYDLDILGLIVNDTGVPTNSMGQNYMAGQGIKCSAILSSFNTTTPVPKNFTFNDGCQLAPGQYWLIMNFTNTSLLPTTSSEYQGIQDTNGTVYGIYTGWRDSAGGTWNPQAYSEKITVWNDTGILSAPANISCDVTACYDSGTNAINISGPTNCSGLYATIGNYAVVANCTSLFASTCISVDANINIVRNTTADGNFTVNGCELRMNQTAQHNIMNWGNFTVTKSNITSNGAAANISDTGPLTGQTDIAIRYGSNFTLSDSFLSHLGYFHNSNVDSQWGINVNSTIFVSNVSITQSFYPMMMFQFSYGSVFKNVSFFLNHFPAYLYINARNTSWTDINMRNNWAGFNVQQGAFNNSFSNLTVEGVMTATAALYVSTNGDPAGGIIGNIFNKVTLINNPQRGFFMSQVTNPNNGSVFTDCYFNNNSAGDVYVTGGEAKLINTIYTTQTITGGTITRQWYLDVYVNNTAGSPIQNVAINVTNATNIINISYTNSTGWSPFRTNITQYTNIAGTDYFAGNYTVYANLSGYTNTSKSFLIGNATTSAYNNTVLFMTLSGGSSPSSVALYDTATNTINITGAADCSSLLGVTGNSTNVVTSCTSPFASTCVSVSASINVTDKIIGGNFTLKGCELRMNETMNGQNVITVFGNMTVIKSNITTNDNIFDSDIFVQSYSNFSIKDSFVSYMGWEDNVYRRGLEINSTTKTFSNTTVTNGYAGVTIYEGANGSVINTSVFKNNYYGIYPYGTGNNTFMYFISNYNTYQVYSVNSNSNYFLGGNISSGNYGDVNYPVALYFSNFNIFQDSFINTTNIFILMQSKNNDFLNDTFTDQSSFTGFSSCSYPNCYYYKFLWYFDSYTNLTNSNPAVGANVSIYNASGGIVNYSITNSSGWIRTLNISQFYADSSGRHYATNYTIYANLSGYKNTSINWNVGGGVSTYTTSDGWVAGDWNLNNTRLTLTLGNTTPMNMSFIYPTMANQTITANSTQFINITTGGITTSACLALVCNASGCVNQTMTIYHDIYFGYDVCSFVQKQASNYNFSVQVFANDSSGVGNYSGVLNISFDASLPIMSNNTVSPSCVSAGNTITMGWIQTGTNIANSTCYWTLPDGSVNTTTVATGNGYRTCSQVTLSTGAGTYQWHLYLNDTTFHSSDSFFNAFVGGSGSCSTGGGGNTGGGGSTVINQTNLPYTVGDGVCDTLHGESVANSPNDCSIDLGSNTIALIAIFIVVIGVIYGFTENRGKHRRLNKKRGVPVS